MVDLSAGFFTLPDVIEIAMELEKNGREFYEKAIESVTDEQSRQFLEYLCEEEKSHYQAFSRMLRENQNSAAAKTQAPPGMDSFVRESMAGRLLSWDEREDIDDSTPFRELVEGALEFERDTILFFQFMRDMVTAEWEKEEIDRIIQEEQRHVDRLASYLRNQA